MSTTKQTPKGMSASSAGGYQTLAILAEAATPELYQRNGFRVLELPADATARDINRRKQTVEKALTHDVPVPPGPGRCFPLSPTPDQFAVREAMQRLGDPERRLVDELFWFWPHRQGEAAKDTALAHLRDGKDKEAEGVWLEQESEHSESSVSTHNLALLYHFRALEKERELLQAEPGTAQADGVVKIWDKSFRRWRTLAGQEGFWSRLTARIRELEDPRLTTGTARRVRGALPSSLICVSARLVLEAVEAGRRESANRVVETIRKSGFEDDAISEGLRVAVEPVRARIKALCKTAELAAENDPVRADKACRQLLENATPLLEGLDTLLPADNPTRQVAHDDVAERALRCQVAFARKTEGWRVSAALLEAALPLASSESVRKKVQENLDIVKKNADNNDDFCGDGYYDLPAAHLEQMESARQMADRQEFDQAIVILESLPRNDLMACPHCQKGLGWTQKQAGSACSCPFCKKEFQAPESPEALPPEARPLLQKALAYCLGFRAIRRLNEALDEWNDHKTSVIRNIQNRADAIDNSTWMCASMETIPQYTNCHCMADGSLIYGRYTVLKWTFNPEKGPVSLIICGSCGDRHRSEMDSIRTKLKNAVRQSAQDFVDGGQLAPENKFVQNQIERVRKMCSDLEIGMPSPQRGRPAKQGKAPSRTSKTGSATPPAIPGQTSSVPASANWAIGLGLVSLVCGLWAAIPAIVCGHVAVSAIDKSAGTLTGRKRAVTGLVLGYISLAIFGMIMLVALASK